MRSILSDDGPTHTSRMPQYHPHMDRQNSNRSHQSSNSYCNTPDLERSYSIESQHSNHESPMTPPAPPVSAYPEHLFPGDKPPIFDSYPKNEVSATISRETKQLPPLRSIVSSDGFNEPTYSFHNRQSASPLIATPYSEYAFPRATYAQPIMQESTVHRSIEVPDDTESPRERLASPAPNSHQQSPRDQTNERRPTSSKAGSSSKVTKDGTNQKRYPCKHPGCPNSYTTSGHASRHAKSHGVERLIKCADADCKKMFNRSDNMKQHLQTHKKDKEKKEKMRNISTATTKPRRDRAQRQMSLASSMSSGRHVSPRESSMAMSPGFPSASLHIPSPGWPYPAHDLPSPRTAYDNYWDDRARPNLASRTPSGLDTLAAVAATKSMKASVEQQQSPEQSFAQYASPPQSRPLLYSHAPQYFAQHSTLSPQL